MNVPVPAWIDRALALLDRSAESLDAATLSRLNRARQAALAQADPGWPIRFACGGLAGAALLLIVAFGAGHFVIRPAPQGSSMIGPAPIDSDPLADDDDLDLYENLDFYAWLDAEQAGDG